METTAEQKAVLPPLPDPDPQKTPPMAVDPYQEFNALYSKFRQETVALGSQLYLKWQELWSTGLCNAFNVPVSVRAVFATIPQGAPPQQLDDLVKAVAERKQVVTQIEFDPEAKLFRLYAGPIV